MKYIRKLTSLLLLCALLLTLPVGVSAAQTAGGDCYPHFHRHVELYYVISGSSSVTINDKTVTLGAGGLAVATPYDIHSYSRKTDGTAYILIVPPQYLSDFLRYTKGKTISCNFIEFVY